MKYYYSYKVNNNNKNAMDHAHVFLNLIVLFLFCISTSYGLDNGVGRTPPMGWMAWERFRDVVDCTSFPDRCVSEKLIKEHIDILSQPEWQEAGYEYVDIDDTWMSTSRNSLNVLSWNATRFPSGMKSLADYAHSKNLKLGIYQDMGTKTCVGYPGVCKDQNCTLPGYMDIDAQTFASWGIDLVKMDGCNSVHTSEILDRGYKYFGKQLNNSGREMIYSCSWPDYIRFAGITVNYTDIAEHCNIWRMYNDVQDDWGSVLNIIDWVGDNQETLINAAGPGHFNDPDSLMIGNFALSYTQAESQMALYSIMAAPLLMGNDLRNLDPKFKAILISKEVIAINQDPLGVQGRRLVHTAACGGNNYYDVWSKPLYNGDLAVVLWNRCPYGVPEKMTVDWKTLGIESNEEIMAVRDLYQEKELGNFTGSISLYVDIDGVRMLRLRKFGRDDAGGKSIT